MKIFLSIFLFLFTFALYASPSVIYGIDNRFDLYEHPNYLFQEIAKATVVIFPKEILKKTPQGFDFLYKDKTYQTTHNVCPEERFSKQPTGGRCSGTLIGEDLILTAAHCVKDMNECKNYYLVFDYHIGPRGEIPAQFSPHQVYECSRIVERKQGTIGSDHALIKLNKSVIDRAPVKYRRQGKIEDNAEIFIAGYPSGLPLKISDDAQVLRNNDRYFFQANLDALHGNSGSGVFNAKTLELEGILARGGADFIMDMSRGCKKVYSVSHNAEDEEFAEHITRVTAVTYLKNLR